MRVKKVVVYADVLIGVNILINYFLLLLTGKICCQGYKTLRVVGGAALGGLFSLYIFLPQQSFWLETVSRAAICLLLVFVSFGFYSFKAFLRNAAVFLGVTFLFGGIMLAVWMIFKPAGVVINNGMVYFDISPLLLIVSTAASYIIITLIRRFTKKDAPQGTKKQVEIFYGSQKNTVCCLIDSGNSLKDMLSDRPVIVISTEKAEKLLGFSLKAETVPAGQVKGYRLIPYTAVGGSGMLPAFKADKAVIDNKELSSVIVAVSDNAHGDDYDGILNPEILAT